MTRDVNSSCFKNLEYSGFLESLEKFLSMHGSKPYMMKALSCFIAELRYYDNSKIALEVLEDFLEAFNEALE